MNKSIPAGTDLEFINITPLNPLISRCEIKVLYSGKNRNGSYISKEVANKIANSLPGTPIVGQYFIHAGDFGDHGEEELVVDKDGVRFIRDTVPYGFVPHNAKVWWANFIDGDGATREYMVTEGYLWTGRYPESRRIIEKGNHHSMEFHRPSLAGEWSKITGNWSKFENDDREYFIVSDAVLSALCILGEDIEPCFEGANITKSSNLVYSLNKEYFKEKMLDFMEDLKLALKDFNCEGGTNNMADENINIDGQTTEPVEPITTASENIEPEDEFAKKKKDEEENNCDDEDVNDDNCDDDNTDDEEEKKKKKKKNFSEENDEEDEFSKKDDEDEDDEFAKKKKKKCGYSLEEVVEYQTLLTEFKELETKYNSVVAELTSIKPEFSRLNELKTQVENKAKDDMIKSFYMLSDEDKKEVIQNKANYSLDEIEAKLSIICVRNKVNFNLDDSSESKSNTETPITTFNVDSTFDSTPAWIKAVSRVAEKRK